MENQYISNDIEFSATLTQRILTAGRLAVDKDEIVRRYGCDKLDISQRFACWIFDEKTCDDRIRTAAIMAGALPGDLVVHVWDRNADGVSLKSLSGFRGVYCPRSSPGMFLFFAHLQGTSS
jgi:hypothetical protein